MFIQIGFNDMIPKVEINKIEIPPYFDEEQKEYFNKSIKKIFLKINEPYQIENNIIIFNYLIEPKVDYIETSIKKLLSNKKLHKKIIITI
jgi:hypothetical protein